MQHFPVMNFHPISKWNLTAEIQYWSGVWCTWFSYLIASNYILILSLGSNTQTSTMNCQATRWIGQTDPNDGWFEAFTGVVWDGKVQSPSRWGSSQNGVHLFWFLTCLFRVFFLFYCLFRNITIKYEFDVLPLFCHLPESYLNFSLIDVINCFLCPWGMWQSSLFVTKRQTCVKMYECPRLGGN